MPLLCSASQALSRGLCQGHLFHSLLQPTLLAHRRLSAFWWSKCSTGRFISSVGCCMCISYSIDVSGMSERVFRDVFRAERPTEISAPSSLGSPLIHHSSRLLQCIFLHLIRDSSPSSSCSILSAGSSCPVLLAIAGGWLHVCSAPGLRVGIWPVSHGC